MSAFSDVDASARGAELAAYLDVTDLGLSAMKSYMADTAARAVPGGRVLDLGCGVGHDLARLELLGLRPIGLDHSARMLERAITIGVPLVRGDAAALPIATASFDGCRIERVLQHVDEPERILSEVFRIVRPGGLVTVFEPDYTTFRVQSEIDDTLPGRLVAVLQPAVGGHLADLVLRNGFVVDDVVTEDSFGYSLEALPQPAERLIRRAVERGEVESHLADRWFDEQRARTAEGSFCARWTKVLVVAHRPH